MQTLFFQGFISPFYWKVIVKKEWVKKQSLWSYLKLVVTPLHYICVGYVEKLCVTNGIIIAITIQNTLNVCCATLFIIERIIWKHIWKSNIILILSVIHIIRIIYNKFKKKSGKEKFEHYISRKNKAGDTYTLVSKLKRSLE